MTQKPGIRKTPITTLVPHPSNPRQGDVGAIIQSIEANGWYGTLVAQISTGHVLAGNHRLQAAIHCGLDRVPVHWVDVDDDTAHRILLADNRTTDLATYDEHALADLLVEMGKTGNLGGTGYDGDDLDDLLAELERYGPDADQPPIPAPPDDPITKPGDVILLGKHRLICGDSLDLLPTLNFDVMVTDPPYGIAWQGSAYNGARPHAGIANDNSTEARDQALKICGDRPAIVFGSINLAPPNNTRHVAIWHKPPDSGVVGSMIGLRRDIETIYLLGDFPKRPAYRSSVYTSSVMGIGNYTKTSQHPHAKPIDVITQLLELIEVDAVLADPFAGSGSTLIAAEQTGRICQAVELNPGYCDVIVQRWEDHTGQTATRP